MEDAKDTNEPNDAKGFTYRSPNEQLTSLRVSQGVILNVMLTRRPILATSSKPQYHDRTRKDDR